MTFDWQPLLLTVKLAAVTTVILLLIGVPLAWWLAYSRFRFKILAEVLVSMPLVLPPSVLGFYLLLLFSPQSAVGHWLNSVLGLHLVFSFEGLVLASVLYSLPFMVQPLQGGFQSLPATLTEAAYTLGKSKVFTLLRVLLPNIKDSLFLAMALTFAHTIGEFGVVLVIGGSIPGVTRVASIAIYDEVESMNYASANLMAAILLATSFLLLYTVYMINKRVVKIR